MASIARPIVHRQLQCLRLAPRSYSRRFAQKPETSLVNPSSYTSSIASPTSPLRSLASQKELKNLTGVGSFHTTSRRPILPPGPQVIEGTANDPAPVPTPEPLHGSYHWAFERLISAALIPLTVAPFAAGTLNPITDAILCATIIIHSHIGFQSVIIDYVPTQRLPKTRAFFWWGLRAATLTVAVGLYEFETNDVGLTEGIKRIWTA